MNILGRYDRVDLPELRVDEYSRQSRYRCIYFQPSLSQGQVVGDTLEFILLDEEHPEFTGMKFAFREFEERDIRNSFGEVERRFVIITTLRIFHEEITTEFSLSNRGSLKFPILIGRKILRNRFLIDITKKNLSYKEKRRRLALKKKKTLENHFNNLFYEHRNPFAKSKTVFNKTVKTGR